MAKNNRQSGNQQTAEPGADAATEETAGVTRAASAKPFDVEDVELHTESPAKQTPNLDETARGKQGDDTRPYCPRHNCLLTCQGSTKQVTKYRCPVPGCETREKRARPQLKIPAEPMACPSRSCAAGGERQFLEANPELTTVAQLHMQCPDCGFNVKVPRPPFTPQLARQRQAAAAEDFAER